GGKLLDTGRGGMRVAEGYCVDFSGRRMMKKNTFFERQRKKEIKMITLPAKSQLNTKSYQSTQKSHKQNTKIKDE
ncbi:MAG: hypothetical protein MJZ24_03015, partial [Paludibacteraceae bacterium]|nr:hypothetical protein [Paludibacteraceae bacterium]